MFECRINNNNNKNNQRNLKKGHMIREYTLTTMVRAYFRRLFIAMGSTNYWTIISLKCVFLLFSSKVTKKAGKVNSTMASIKRKLGQCTVSTWVIPCCLESKFHHVVLNETANLTRTTIATTTTITTKTATTTTLTYTDIPARKVVFLSIYCKWE